MNNNRSAALTTPTCIARAPSPRRSSRIALSGPIRGSQPLAEYRHRPGTPVKGVYRVIGKDLSRSPVDGRDTFRMTIADATDMRLCCGYLSKDDTVWATLCDGALVSIRGRVEMAPTKRAYVQLTEYQPVEAAIRPNWDLLPITYVPHEARGAFTRLRGVLNRLEGHVPLLEFMNRVMGDVALAERFVQSSYRFDGSAGAPGRLLIDSVTRAENAERVAPRLVGQEDALVVVVGALLRDIGAIAFKPSQAPLLKGSELMEQLTFKVLDDHIGGLEAKSRRAWLALAEMLAPVMAQEATGFEGRTLCTDLVEVLDTLTTGDRWARSKHTIRTSSGGELVEVTLPDQ
ncbi:hypothetical protein [Salinisphaera aquimarina]|uniref:OB-fold nucleic acid binding domain-containing protein n=1 Tax=Salinisphaera aquimarina TaxID=2094031 RepID=A0ABV7EQF9_9GAMM